MAIIEIKDKQLNVITANYVTDNYDLENHIVSGMYFDPEQYELTELVEDETEGEEQETETNENE